MKRFAKSLLSPLVIGVLVPLENYNAVRRDPEARLKGRQAALDKLPSRLVICGTIGLTAGLLADVAIQAVRRRRSRKSP